MKPLQSPRRRNQFLLRYTLQSLAAILILAVLLRTFIFSSLVMSGAGMLPSVLPGEFLLGLRRHFSEVKRGDVMTVRCPPQRERLCLKRVIGLPGDRVEFHADGLIVNGHLATYRALGVFENEAVEGTSWVIWPEKGGFAASATVVLPRHVYLLNDKRSDHDDSRVCGPVPLDLVESKIIFVWMSLDWYDEERVRSWPRLRWNRLFWRVTR